MVNYLLDTNVLSEPQRPRPDQQVMAWLDQVDEDRTYLSVITVGEIARGVCIALWADAGHPQYQGL